MYHRHQRIMTLCLSAYLSIAVGGVSGQEPQHEPQKEKPVTITATEVVVDVIITDKRNRLVKDLTLDDFEVFEDGVKQVIKSARLETRVENRSGKTESPTAPSEPRAEIAPPSSPPRIPNTFIILAFDNLSMSRSSQVFARRAGKDYIESMPTNDRLAVFGIDTRLFLVQGFTNDKKALKKAIAQATAGTSRKFASSTDAIERILQTQTPSGATQGGQPTVESSTASTLGPASTDSTAGADPDAMLITAFRSFETFEREVQARSSILGLLALIQAQRALPGRKTIIFFSEGFSLPINLSRQFQSVIGAANRANVAIYTIDAGGLRVENEDDRASRELSSIADQRARGADPTLVVGGESMLGRAERLSRLNRESVLQELAESTGGLAIRNTNDLRSGLRRIDKDMRSYYLLTYAPTNQNFDGHFRTIEVKVKRPKVKVRARKGYFALRTADGSPVFEFERPLFDLLSAASPPHDFEFKLAAMHFPKPTEAVTAPIVAEIPLGIVTFKQPQLAAGRGKKKKKKTVDEAYVGGLDVLALVKDARGVVLHKLSQNYKLRYDAGQLDDVKKSTLLFYRNTVVPAGAYEVDMVARDMNSGRASIARIPVLIPQDPSPSLRISSLVATKGGQALSAGEYDQTNPFHFGRTAITPNLSHEFSKTDDQMMFYFTVQASPGASVKAKVEFLQAGQILAQAPGALPAPDDAGRIQFVASFPVAPFPVGAYKVRVTVDDGSHKASAETPFSVIN